MDRWTFTPSCLMLAAAAFGLLAHLSLARAQTGACPDLEHRFDTTGSELAAPQVSALLFSAADNGCEALARRLLEAGASVQAQDREGSMALIHAAKAGHAAMVDLLVARGADVNQRNIKGATPLYVAAENNRARAAQALLDHGADVNLPGRSNVSALSAAAFNGNDKIVDLLVTKGADVHLQDFDRQDRHHLRGGSRFRTNRRTPTSRGRGRQCALRQ